MSNNDQRIFGIGEDWVTESDRKKARKIAKLSWYIGIIAPQRLARYLDIDIDEVECILGSDEHLAAIEDLIRTCPYRSGESIEDWWAREWKDKPSAFAKRMRVSEEAASKLIEKVLNRDLKYTTRTEKRLLKSEKYKIYFQSLIDELREEHAFTKARVAQGDNWYNFASGITGITYGVWFRRDGQTAVYVQIDEKSFKKSERLTFFDRLEAHYGEIAVHFNLPLSWQPRPKKTYSLISMCRDGDIEASADELEAIRDWHVESLLKFKTVFQPIIEKLLPS